MAMPLPPLIDVLPALVSALDRDLRYVEMNAAHHFWFGVDPAAMIGASLWDVIGEDLHEPMAPLLARALAGEASDVEHELPARFDLRYVRMMILPRQTADGAVAGVAFLVTDLSKQRALQLKLQRSDKMFNDAFMAAGVGKALVDTDGIITRANPAFAGMLGHPVETLQGRGFAEITHPDDLAQDIAQFEALGRGEIDGYQMEKRYFHRDGSIVAALLSVSMVRPDSRGQGGFYVAQIVDIRDRKAAEQRLRERHTQLSLALDVLEGGVWQLDIATGMLTVSEGFARLMGGDPLRASPVTQVAEAICAEDRCDADMSDLIAGREDRSSATFRIIDPQGRQRWVRCRRQLLRDDDGAPAKVLGLLVDVSEDHAHEVRLAKEAITDPLTGLLNRRGFDAALADAVAAVHPDAGPALLLIDLDRFKPINDRLGHAAGDRVLREVARRIETLIRAGDSVARLGGDEFAVLLNNADRAAAERAGSRIVAALAEPYRTGEMEARSSASIGIALADAADMSPQTLVERADMALYAVKRGGRGAWRLAA